MLKDITEDKPLVVKCQSDWVIHANDKDFDLKRVQETLKNCSQRDKRAMIFRGQVVVVRRHSKWHLQYNSQQAKNKEQDSSKIQWQVQKEVRTGKVDLLLGRLTDTLGKSLDPKRIQQALKNSLEGNYIWRDRKFMWFSLVQTDDSCEETGNTGREKHKAELWTPEAIL